MSERLPGIVAMAVRSDDGGEFLVVRTRGGESGDYWSAPKGWPAGVSTYDIADFRPLAVVDPEDREQVERLGHLLWKFWETQPNSMQAATLLALREFANPPKPEVYEHLATTATRATGNSSTYAALCGKVWLPNDPDTVTIVGRCPECAALAESEWIA